MDYVLQNEVLFNNRILPFRFPRGAAFWGLNRKVGKRLEN